MLTLEFLGWLELDQRVPTCHGEASLSGASSQHPLESGCCPQATGRKG